MMRAACLLLLAFSLGGRAQESTAPPSTPTQEPPNVEDLGEGRFRIGLVTIDQATRTLAFPATVNMDEGKLEFAIVHEQGKIHESLLSTKVDAFNLNVGLKLLRYQESPELFQILDEYYRPTGNYPEVPEETREAARLAFFVSWKDREGTTRRASINDWILHTPSKAAVPAGPWVYGGSYLHNGAFQAKAQGEIAAIFTSSISLFNLPAKDHELDDVWEPMGKVMPAVGTPVTVTLQPHQKSSP